MIRVLVMTLVTLSLAGCSPALAGSVEPAPAPVVNVEPASDPAETGMCLGRYIRVEVPEVPEGVADPEGFLLSYYETYTRAYCDELTKLRTLSV